MEVDEDDDDDEDMEENENEFEDNSTSPTNANNMVDITPINQQYSNKANVSASNKTSFSKQISSSSSVVSMSSSTAATVGSANTTLRGKRKKDFEDDDEDDNTTTGVSEYEESINNDLQSVSSGYKVNIASSDMGALNFIPGDTIEITANQNNNQQINNNTQI